MDWPGIGAVNLQVDVCAGGGDAAGGRAQGDGEVVGEGADVGEAGARGGGEGVLDPARGEGDGDDVGRVAMGVEALFDEGGLVV